MRIVITADLHYRPSQRGTYLAFARWVEAQQPDCFIVAGDTGHPLRLFGRALQLFDGLTCPKLLLAGNHDVYRGEHDSRNLWETLLPQATRDAGFVWLEDTVVRLGALGIAGSMAWYDYSSRSGHLPQGAAELRLLKAVVNHDADFIDWPWSDVAMARFLARRFAARLDSLASDPTVDQILVVTHVPIFPEMRSGVPVQRDLEPAARLHGQLHRRRDRAQHPQGDARRQWPHPPPRPLDCPRRARPHRRATGRQ